MLIFTQIVENSSYNFERHVTQKREIQNIHYNFIVSEQITKP